MIAESWIAGNSITPTDIMSNAIQEYSQVHISLPYNTRSTESCYLISTNTLVDVSNVVHEVHAQVAVTNATINLPFLLL